METVFFSLPGNETLTNSLAEKCKGSIGSFEYRHFPDGETYVKVNTVVTNKRVVVVCTLNNPDEKLLLLYFLCQAVKDLKANSCCLVAPYLSYMRQDTRFNPGEAITSAYFAKLISSFADQLITIDPHLHRRSSLSEIYSIPTTVLHASHLISSWIIKNIKDPVLIGPDIESEQWVKQIAEEASAPFFILEKIRTGDEDVSVSVPVIENFKNRTPVLVDDIISTAKTMIVTINTLQKLGMKPPVCIGIHGIFANNSYDKLLNAGAGKIITSNSIPHFSNHIVIDEMIAKSIIS